MIDSQGGSFRSLRCASDGHPADSESMQPNPHIGQRWTRWHADDWTLVVVQTDEGEFFYTVSRGNVEGAREPASSRVDAQHRAEERVRRSGHRCVARCSFWVPDTPEDLD